MKYREIEIPAQGRNRDYKFYGSGASMVGGFGGGGGGGGGGSFLDKYFSFDEENDVLIAKVNLASEKEIAAYFDNGSIPSIFDSIPFATSSKVGGIKAASTYQNGIRINSSGFLEIDPSYADSGVSSWNDLTDKPTSFPPSAHNHPISDITGLQTALNGKLGTGAQAYDSARLGGQLASKYPMRDVGETITGRWVFTDRVRVTHTAPRYEFFQTDVENACRWALDGDFLQMQRLNYATGVFEGSLIIIDINAPSNSIRVTPNGNVGFGIVPTEKLHVVGNGLFTGNVTAQKGTFNDNVVLRGDRNTLALYYNQDGVAKSRVNEIILGREDNFHRWRILNLSTSAWGNNPDLSFQYLGATGSVYADVLTMTYNRNVGIGIASPTEKLHVVGNGLFTGNITAQGDIKLGTTLNALIKYDAVNDVIRFNKTIVSDYDVVAYADSGQDLPSIFDNLPKASTTNFGLVKIGSGISVTGGVISVDGDTFNLSNYYTKTEANGLFGEKLDVSTFNARTISAGNGLTGGGALSANRTVTLGTPSTISATSTNSVTASSHTHNLDLSSATANNANRLGNVLASNYLRSDIVDKFNHLYVGYDWASKRNGIQIGVDGLNSGLSFYEPSVDVSASIFRDTDSKFYIGARSGVRDRGIAIDQNGVVSIAGNVVATQNVSILAGNGLSGGGTISANRTITLGTPSTISASSTNSVTSTSHTHAISLSKSDIGLGNVGNYSDYARKTISESVSGFWHFNEGVSIGTTCNNSANSTRYYKIGYFTLLNQHNWGHVTIQVKTRHGANHTIFAGVERTATNVSVYRTFQVIGKVLNQTYYLVRTSANVMELWLRNIQAYDNVQISILNTSTAHKFTPDFDYSGTDALPTNESVVTCTNIIKTNDADITTTGSLNVSGNITAPRFIGVADDSSKLGGVVASDYVRRNIREGITHRWNFNGGINVGVETVYQDSSGVVVGSIEPISDYGGKTALILNAAYSSNILGFQTSAGCSNRTTMDELGNWNMAKNITAQGEVTAYSSSDIRLKQNIKPIKNALDIISKLNPVSFNWNSKAIELNKNKDSDRANYGVVAQELEELLPDLIHETNGFKSVDYPQLIMILAKGIQELKSEIEELKNK